MIVVSPVRLLGQKGVGLPSSLVSTPDGAYAQQRTIWAALLHRPIVGRFASPRRGHWASGWQANSADHSRWCPARSAYRPTGQASEWLIRTSASFQHYHRSWNIRFSSLHPGVLSIGEMRRPEKRLQQRRWPHRDFHEQLLLTRPILLPGFPMTASGL
jgi:hypothetical protein